MEKPCSLQLSMTNFTETKRNRGRRKRRNPKGGRKKKKQKKTTITADNTKGVILALDEHEKKLESQPQPRQTKNVCKIGDQRSIDMEEATAGWKNKDGRLYQHGLSKNKSITVSILLMQIIGQGLWTT